MARMTPSLNAKGLYTLRAPWATMAGKSYECIAIRSFSDFVDRGLDVLTKVYTPVVLTATEMEADRAEGAMIVTLQSGDSPLILVPDTYITAYPAQDGVAYSRVVLSVDLGAIPDGEALNFVKDQIAATVSTSFGITPTVLEHIAPSTNYVTQAQHDQVMVGRRAAIEAAVTDRARLLEASATVDQLRIRVQELEQILIAEGLLN